MVPPTAGSHPQSFRLAVADAYPEILARCGTLGRREKGLAAVEEAVTIYRELADANPAAHLPHLVMSLNNLANSLQALGRTVEADAAKSEAATLQLTQ